MSFINGPVFTSAGKTLHARAVAGATLTFTKMQLGDGAIGGNSVESLTALINPVASVGVSGLRHSGNFALVRGIFSNADLTTGFYWREIGLFAADPDFPNDRSKDILYCYQNAADLAEYIAASGSEIITKRISIAAIVDSAANVTATLNAVTSAADVIFEKEGTTLDANDVQSAIMELDGKKLNTADAITLAQVSKEIENAVKTVNNAISAAMEKHNTNSAAHNDLVIDCGTF